MRRKSALRCTGRIGRQSLGFPAFALAGIDGDGRVQMAMNGGIYDKAYAPLGLYIEDGKRLTPVNCRRRRELIRPGGVFPSGKRPGENRAAAGVQTPLPPSAMRCSPARC